MPKRNDKLITALMPYFNTQGSGGVSLLGTNNTWTNENAFTEGLTTGDGVGKGIGIGSDTELYRSAANIIYTTDTIQSTLHITAPKLTASADGISGGVFIGTDAQLYRSAANRLRTPDALQVDGRLYFGSGGTSEIYESATNWLRTPDNFVSEQQLQSTLGGTSGGLVIGADTQIYRSASNLLRTPDSLQVDSTLWIGATQDTALLRSAANTLKTPDNFWAAAILYIGSTQDTALVRNAANHLRTGSGDYFNVYAGLRVGDATIGTDNDIRAAADIAAGGGVYAGNVAGEPSDGYMIATNNYQRYENSATHTGSIYVPLTTILTTTTYDGDSFSTRAKTLMDMSALFGSSVGFAGIKAYYLHVYCRDSGSDSTLARGTLFWDDNVADYGIYAMCGGLTNDAIARQAIIVPANGNGDIYNQFFASGASTLDVWIRVLGYFL